MGIPNFYQEMIVFTLLLFAVFGVYLLLKLHYQFAFGLMKNTASYEKHKVKIETVKTYLFRVLKILLWLGLVAMTLFCITYLYEGLSLKRLVLELWGKIPEGFWLNALFMILRIAVIIVLSRYLLKFVYAFLDKQQQQALEKRCTHCREATIRKFYSRLHYMVKYTVLLGILYRITLFFSFLEVVSAALWVLLILYIVGSFGLLGGNLVSMIKERRGGV